MPICFQRALLAILLAVGIVQAALAQKPGEGQLELTVTDGPDGPPVPCRIHIANQAGVARRATGKPFWHDHFVCAGTVDLKYPKGNYTLLVERGPEYADHSGYFVMQSFSKDRKTIHLKRAVDMAAEGWWSGDLHVHRRPTEIELFMRADDLHVAPVVVWSNADPKRAATDEPPTFENSVVRFDENRFYDLSAGEDRRAGGSLLYFRLPKPLSLPLRDVNQPSTTDELAKARSTAQAWIDAAAPWSWDLPLWLAADGLDSIQVLNESFGRTQMAKQPIVGRAPPGGSRNPGADGGQALGVWAQQIYFHVLNCGLRIPPSAGSGTGEGPNHLGYNRVYVWVDREDFDYAAWWEGFRRGRVVVTNGPLIRPLANGRLPGHTFTLSPGQPLAIDIAMNMAIREQVRYMEIIQDGRLAQSIRLEDWAKTGHFPPVTIDSPGWFLVRVVTETKGTYRAALSAPWYVESNDGQSKISRKSAQFFLTWLEERAAQLGAAPEAQKFWEALLARANAD
ncbi:MAG TPA: hypothetical protein VG713_04035 [Pirellulales bacterium]|nr:hypothetical protein [Pirellulales bacterium]